MPPYPFLKKQESIYAFGKSSHWTYVALVYWCDDVWPVCCGGRLRPVVKEVKKYLKEYPAEYNSKGDFVNGIGAEGYWIYKIPVL